MEKYRHIIESIVGSQQTGNGQGSIEGLRQPSPNTLQKTIEELRRTNYRLQNEKVELEMKLR